MIMKDLKIFKIQFLDISWFCLKISLYFLNHVPGMRMPVQVPIYSIRRVLGNSSYAGSHTKAKNKVFILLYFFSILF